MGTETKQTEISKPTFKSVIVKLNNPLMGTETSMSLNHVWASCTCNVKLNNPLMGTETVVRDTSEYLM